jgi:hypothetical protein
MNKAWIVLPTKAVERAALKLPQRALLQFRYLFNDLVHRGPALPDWPNYGRFGGVKGDKRHCHLQKGRPTYVCCWELKDKNRKLIEVYYVGTHEKAPY